MDFREYEELAMRTNDRKSTDRIMNLIESHDWNAEDIGGILNASLGLSGEVGEINDMIKKWAFHGHGLSMEEAEKEIGDILWYVAMMCRSFGFDMQAIAEQNIAKLKKRYPEGFSEEASRNRVE